MDFKFLDDLFLNQEDFATLEPVHGAAPGEVSDFDGFWNQKDYGDATTAQADQIDPSSYWNQFMAGHDHDLLLDESGKIEQAAAPAYSFNVPRLPTSEVEFNFNLAQLPWNHEFHQDPSDSFFPACFATPMNGEPDIQLCDRTEISPALLTPTTSSASSDNGWRTLNHNENLVMACIDAIPAVENIERNLLNPVPLNQQDHRWIATLNTNVNLSQKNQVNIIQDLTVSPAAFGSQGTLPPAEHLMTAFESQPPKWSVKRSKKAYNTEQRKKVSQVRSKRACWHCQIRKTACSTQETCTRCQAMTKNAKLSGTICLRQKLLDVFLSHSSIYDMIIKSQERNRAAIRFVPHSTEQISFQMEDMIESSPPLTLTVTKYERMYPESGFSGSYTRPVSWHPPSNDQRALHPTAVPGIEQLDSMSRAGVCVIYDPFLDHELHDRIDHVLVLCSERPLQRSMIDLVAATLRVVNLRSFLMHSLVFPHSGPADDAPQEYSYADPVLNQHIRAIALTGIAKAEKFVLAKFNDLHRLLSLDKTSMTVAQICLLRLMLVYRNDVLLCERSVEIPVKSRVIFAARLEKVRFMYRMLATTYGTLCDKTSSFGKFDLPEDIADNDRILSTSFAELREAVVTFCEMGLKKERDEVLNYFLLRTTKQR